MGEAIQKRWQAATVGRWVVLQSWMGRGEWLGAAAASRDSRVVDGGMGSEVRDTPMQWKATLVPTWRELETYAALRSMDPTVLRKLREIVLHAGERGSPS